MDDVVAKTRNELYEDDFYAWTQEQVRLLGDGRIDEADIANILEEIGSLGRQQVAELRSRLKVLALHLLKEIYQPRRASRSRRSTILNQRQELARHVKGNPSLQSKQSIVFVEVYEDVRVLAAAETGLAQDTFPIEPPFSLDQALDLSFWPGRPYDDRR